MIRFFGDFFANDDLLEGRDLETWSASMQAFLAGQAGVLNFEGSLAYAVPPKKQVSLQTKPGVAQVLKRAGFSAACLANNHIGDGGHGSVVNSRKALESSGLQCFGAGSNLAEARQPAKLVVGGHRVALLGYCSEDKQVGGIAATHGSEGTAPIDPDYMEADIKAIRDKVDIVAVYLHWGTEYRRIPHRNQVLLAHRLRLAGADLILGVHPHVPQSYEQKHNIYYSLGNFIFPEVQCQDGARLRWDAISRTGICVECSVEGDEATSSPRVFHIDRNGLARFDQPVSSLRRRMSGAVEYIPRQIKHEQALLRLEDLYWGARRFALWRPNELAAVVSRRIHGKRWH